MKWKSALIITIPKSGKDHKIPINYRPTALLSSLSNTYERVILQNLTAVVDGKNRTEQHAFHRQHSTILQLINLTDTLCLNFNNHLKTAAIFLDVEKAFDRVWHHGLLHEMSQLNTLTTLIKIMQSFLSDRTFRVRVENQLSINRPVHAGVPQGSCLSPYLHLLYMNEIPSSRQSQISLFANDTMLYCTDKNYKRATIKLQHHLDTVSASFSKWRLKINTNKTIVIFFNKCSYTTINTLKINGSSIPWTHYTKYLGVTLDSNLSFNHHIKDIVKKATSRHGMVYPFLNRCSPVPLKTKINIFKMYVRPLLTYAGQS